MLRATLSGALAGLAGTAAMTLAEKIEQQFTRRPNSYVPAHTLERTLGGAANNKWQERRSALLPHSFVRAACRRAG